jgi:hypothetical protein
VPLLLFLLLFLLFIYVFIYFHTISLATVSVTQTAYCIMSNGGVGRENNEFEKYVDRSGRGLIYGTTPVLASEGAEEGSRKTSG